MFLRTTLHPVNEVEGNMYLSCLFFGMVHMMFNGFSELPIMISRLPVFYKQRDNLFHPAWAWSLSSWLLRVPYSIIEAVVWSCVVYYTVGFAPGAGRSVFAFLHVMIGFLELHSNIQTCLQVFPIHAFTLRCSSNGTGSLPNAGIGDKRHGYFQYVWIGCPSRYIPLGWISHSERFAHYLIVQVKFNLLKDFAHG